MYPNIHLIVLYSVPLASLHLKLIFDFSACRLVLMLMACCNSGDSKGDGLPEWTSVLYKVLSPDGPRKI